MLYQRGHQKLSACLASGNFNHSFRTSTVEKKPVSVLSLISPYGRSRRGSSQYEVLRVGGGSVGGLPVQALELLEENPSEPEQKNTPKKGVQARHTVGKGKAKQQPQGYVPTREAGRQGKAKAQPPGALRRITGVLLVRQVGAIDTTFHRGGANMTKGCNTATYGFTRTPTNKKVRHHPIHSISRSLTRSWGSFARHSRSSRCRSPSAPRCG